jgi:hypothetical protein
MSKQRNKILQDCKNELDKSFNIFRDLSIDSKFNEINHSKMLKKIFSSDTPDICDKEYLNIFIRLIEKIKETEIGQYFDNGFSVETEVGRKNNIKESGGIDIFISDNEYCIIIENKITGKAGDKENQLARYYRIAKELKKEPLAIVYMPFYFNRPPINNYTGVYKKYINVINKLLVILPAWDPKGGNDLTRGFLDKCRDYAKDVNNKTAEVCFDQYSKFIKGKGELEQMATNGDKEFIKEIFSDINMRKTIEDIVEIWKNYPNIMGELFLDYFIEKHQFKHITEDKYGEYHGKMVNNDIFIYFHPEELQFGFGSISGTMSQNIQDKLKKLLEKNADFVDFKGSDCMWVYGHIKQEILNMDNIESMYRVLTLKLKEYEKQALKLM